MDAQEIIFMQQFIHLAQFEFGKDAFASCDHPDILFHAFYIEDLVEEYFYLLLTDAKEQVGPFGGPGNGSGRQYNFLALLYFIHRLQEPAEFDRFQQVVDDVEFITFQGIFCISRGQYNKRGIRQ